ncbi:hypothetical protein [Mesorhizobium sp. ES1-1]|uniref:hypothetical protein n=1 Tax=Mesorhizobium sp. ES1-1 TaxID=2876629 RepID=UPI001CCE2162|nr:hypothetical protein [Mesorhizobium sp. ES1-1]MBZ9675243.1 hypothetical protein [Mesorhizobium sp. ES1-1]
MTEQPRLMGEASAEAIFGSTSRGDTDSLSDRDILIVDDNPQVLHCRSEILSREGWSVASYTFAKLEAIAGAGALFIQHLKIEATIISDRDGRLAAILRSFEPRTDYGAELIQNARLAALAAEVSPGSRGALLAADILFVAVRNHGVLLLAQLGIHRYSYSAILYALEDQRLISKGASQELGRLRFFKCLYRAGEAENGRLVLKAIDRALAMLKQYHFPPKARQVSSSAIIYGAPPEEPASAYLHLRDLERRMVALEASYPGSLLDTDVARLSSWIANPRAYAALSERLAPDFRAKIAELLRDISLTQMAVGGVHGSQKGS